MLQWCKNNTPLAFSLFYISCLNIPYHINVLLQNNPSLFSHPEIKKWCVAFCVKLPSGLGLHYPKNCPPLSVLMLSYLTSPTPHLVWDRGRRKQVGQHRTHIFKYFFLEQIRPFFVIAFSLLVFDTTTRGLEKTLQTLRL